MNYTDENRGLIQNMAIARQIIDFSGLRLGHITPTDIKRNGVKMPRGQELSLRNLVDALRRDGKFPALLLCDHDVTDPEDDINAEETIVRTIYLGNGLEKPGHGLTAKEATDLFLDYVKQKTYGG